MNNRRAFLKKYGKVAGASLFTPFVFNVIDRCEAQVIPSRRRLFIGSQAAAYSATAATFAGDNQCWLELDSTDSAADGNVGILSFWWNPGTGDATARAIFTTNNRVGVSRGGGDNSLRIHLDSSAGVQQINMQQNTGTVASLTSTSGWSWIAMAWDTATAGDCWIYIANAATSWVATDCTTRNTDLGAGTAIDWTDTDFSFGDNLGGGSQPINGCLSEFYLDITTKRVLTSSSVRDLFYNSTTHKPAGNLSSVGSPIFYLRGDGAGWNVNSGNGGNLTKKGTTAFTSCTGP